MRHDNRSPSVERELDSSKGEDNVCSLTAAPRRPPCDSRRRQRRGSGGRATFKVTSTLDGKTALPHRIQWLATVRGAQAREVDFLIDGKLRWVHHHLPYYYGDFSDSPGTVDRGYLVTSWLEPGLHHFTVRATSTSGQTATDTVVARVAPTPDPPSALAGTWQRVVNPVGAPKPGSPGAPKDTPTPAGTYKLVIDKRWIQTRNPGTFTHASVDKNTGLGYIQDTDYVPTPPRSRSGVPSVGGRSATTWPKKGPGAFHGEGRTPPTTGR